MALSRLTDTGWLIAFSVLSQYSSIAYTFTGAEKPVAQLIYDWPGARGQRLQKVQKVKAVIGFA